MSDRRGINDLLDDLTTAERAVKRAKERLGRAPKAIPNGAAATALTEDESAFRPAHEVLAVVEQFKTHRQLRNFLDKNPSVRRKHTSRFRLRIHTGELVAQIAKMNLAKFQSADVPISTAAHLADELRNTKAARLKAAR